MKWSETGWNQMDLHAYLSPRAYLETEVAERARHTTSEEVRTTFL